MMMPFWSNLPSYTGPMSRLILLGGRFAQQLSDHNPKGKVTIITSHDLVSDITYLDDTAHTRDCHTMEVYWLPWLHGEITTATIAELNQSGCQYFLTSTFTGCRFVATDEAVSHVAFTQYGLGDSSEARDLAEIFMPGPKSKRRRKLSITGSTVPLSDEISTSHTYGSLNRLNGQLQGSAVVVGYRTGNRWHFKALIDSFPCNYWIALN